MAKKKKFLRRNNSKNSEPSSELFESRWAVVAPGGCFACNITYLEAEAYRAASQTDESKTIVTSEAAAKICRRTYRKQKIKI